MTTETAATPSNVVQLKTPKSLKRRSEAKWGTDVIAQGFTILPSMLFRAQKRLGLSMQQLAVIVQLSDFWWREDELPWPKKGTLAERLGITEKQVQRLCAQLEKAGYIQRVTRMTGRGQTSNGYDLSGLRKKLQDLVPEFAEAAAAKRRVERRGGLKASA